MEQRPYIFDLHNHTKKSLPEILPYDYKQAIRQAKLLGLNGIAITEHNTLRGLREALEEADRQGIILVPGAEISDISFSGIFPTSHHILALGIDPGKVNRVPVLRTAKDIIGWIHDSDGVALGVHAKPESTFMSMSYKQLEEIASLLDGMEVINGGDLLKWGLMENTRMKELAVEYGLAQTGGSDSHSLNTIGVVATKVFGNCGKWQDVITAIRENRVEPFIRSAIPIGLGQKTIGFSDMLFSG